MLPELFVSKSLQKQPASEAIQFWSADVCVRFPAHFYCPVCPACQALPLRWKAGGILEVASVISVPC